jgi:hypothetical protein
MDHGYEQPLVKILGSGALRLALINFLNSNTGLLSISANAGTSVDCEGQQIKPGCVKGKYKYAKKQKFAVLLRSTRRARNAICRTGTDTCCAVSKSDTLTDAIA